MRKEFVECKNREQAVKACPWSAYIVKAERQLEKFRDSIIELLKDLIVEHLPENSAPDWESEAFYQASSSAFYGYTDRLSQGANDSFMSLEQAAEDIALQIEVELKQAEDIKGLDNKGEPQ